MKKYFLAAAVVFFLASCGDSSSVKNDPALSEMLETQWSNYLTSIKQDVSGISIYMITPKGEYFASTSGMDNASPDVHFRAASNTKTFTSAAIMLLQQEGKLNINDLITSKIPGTDQPYIPDTPEYHIPYKGEMTIKDLLSHRAGVFDVINDKFPTDCNVPWAGAFYTEWARNEYGQDHTFTPDELVSTVARCQVSFFKPGTSHHYSNTGYSMLVKIIERVSGTDYSDFVETRLITPNGLYDTSSPHIGTDRWMPDPFQGGYWVYNGQPAYIDNDNMSENLGEGNLVSTPANLARWIRRLIKGETAITPDSIAQMTECVTRTTPTSCYGLGIITAQGAEAGAGHNGAHQGYMSLMLHDPEKDITTVIFANLTNFDDMQGEQAALTAVWYDAYKALGL